MADRALLLLALEDPSVLELMQRALRSAGYEVDSAADGEALQGSLNGSSPALILIGESFAGRSGLALSEEILERFPTLPIILYCEQSTPTGMRAAMDAGLSSSLFPPLRTDEIQTSVSRALARSRRLGERLRIEVKRTTSSLEERTRLSEAERRRYESLLSNIQDGVIVLDAQKRILFLNPAVRTIFELGTEDATGRPLEEVIPHPDMRSLLSRASGEPLKYHELNLDGGQVLNAQLTPIPGIGSAITMQDITYLKELERLKDDFVQTVSHDLRSPLTALLGYAELISRVGPLTAQQQDFLGRIQASVHHITTLVNDLLDLSRLEAGFDTRREIVQMGAILEYTMDGFESQAHIKEIELHCQAEPDLPPLRANPIRIRQLLDNLVGNAIKYTPNHGVVHVRLGSAGRQVILEVKDTGPGIPHSEQGHIFEKFYRASNAPEGVQGTGLGLAIVKSIVDGYDGRIWVESTVGQGSSFFVVLPAEA
jgi:PAS domain S-box-containing protein